MCKSIIADVVVLTGVGNVFCRRDIPNIAGSTTPNCSPKNVEMKRIVFGLIAREAHRLPRQWRLHGAWSDLALFCDIIVAVDTRGSATNVKMGYVARTGPYLAQLIGSQEPRSISCWRFAIDRKGRRSA